MFYRLFAYHSRKFHLVITLIRIILCLSQNTDRGEIYKPLGLVIRHSVNSPYSILVGIAHNEVAPNFLPIEQFDY